VAAIKTDGVTREEPSHHRGKGCQTRSEKKMGMLCEAQDYVKLSFHLSRISLPFLPHFTASNDITPHNFML
jgi:hypothetical protein